jgi:hypothetical protein
MAAHVHTQIRAAAVAALTGLTTSGARVYANRLYAMDDANLPGLRVFTDAEEVTSESIHQPHVQARRLHLVVEACAKANTALDSTLDTMAKEIETALAGPLSVGGKALYPLLTGSQYDDEAAGVPVGVKRLEYTLDYFTLNNAPDALI